MTDFLLPLGPLRSLLSYGPAVCGTVSARPFFVFEHGYEEEEYEEEPGRAPICHKARRQAAKDRCVRTSWGSVTIYSEQNVQEAGRKTGASHILDDDDEWLIPMRSKPSLRRLDSVLMLSGPAHSANGTMLCARTGLVRGFSQAFPHGSLEN